MDDGLFADPRPVQPQPPATNTEALPDWQIASLRKGLDDLGLMTMEERQSLVVELAGRRVASLRDLTFAEARAVTEGLAARKGPTQSSGSAWDNRDAETWIDQL